MGCGGAIAVWDMEGRSLLGMWRGDRFFWDVGGRSLFENVRGRSLWGCGKGDRFLGMWAIGSTEQDNY
ncbi:MAG: hypothetical protein ACKPJP_31020 [Microcystis panniformis]